MAEHPPAQSAYIVAFRRWLSDHPQASGVALRETSANHEALEFQVEGYGEQLLLIVRDGDIALAAIKDGEVWDLLYAQESVVQSCVTDYFCGLCEVPAKRYATPQALWLEHDFEALAKWLQENIATKPVLKFNKKGGMTWVEL
jgi:hypothetical protein